MRARGKRLLASVRRRGHLIVFALVLAVALGVRFGNIRRSLPYCGGVDEKTWIQIAWRMMRTGDLNPKRFTKPSLPVYLMLAGSSVGLISSAGRGEAYKAKQLGKEAFPYYRAPRVVEAPKRLFASLSVAALALLGLIARGLTGRPAALWLAPLFALVSASYSQLSWYYMNVDIVGAFFAWATVCQLVQWYRRETAAPTPASSAGIGADALIAGALAGATIGCKYNLGVILLPCLLTVIFIGGQRVVARACLLLLASAFVFALVTPYALLDFSTFLHDVTREVRHYGTSHRGKSIERGWPMFGRYLGGFHDDWGTPLLLGALAGQLWLARRDVRSFLIVTSFPVALVFLMSMQRTFFFRNVVAVQLWIALGLAAACVAAPAWVGWARRRVPELRGRRYWSWGFSLVAAALVLVGLPWSGLEQTYASEVSSRRAATEWLTARVPEGGTVLVEDRLRMDTSELPGAFQVVPFKRESGKDKKRARALKREHPGALALVPVSNEPFYVELASGAAVLETFGSTPLNPKKGATNLDPKFVVLRLPPASP